MNDKKKKVVPFPNLKKRLLEKAMESMKERKFEEALILFDQAHDNSFAHSEVELGSVVCLMELGRLTEAKNRCKKMLREDIGDYFHVLQIYITILIQLKEYDEVKVTIEAILQEDKIPAEQAQTFFKLLDFARKMLPKGEFEEYKEAPTDDSVSEDLLKGTVQEQFGVLQRLKSLNARIYREAIETYLIDEGVHPILKTILLETLHDQQWDDETKITKLGQTVIVRPSKLDFKEIDPFFAEIGNLIEQHVYSENPSLFEALKGMIFKYHTVVYPIGMNDENVSAWAASIHLIGQQLYGIEDSMEKLSQLYNVALEDIEKVSTKVQKLEEISYLQL